MSFILKALKKLENEKAAQKAAPVEINSALLAPDKGYLFTPRRKGRWAIVALLLIGCAGAAYFYLHGTPAPIIEVEKTPPMPPPAREAAPTVPASSALPQAPVKPAVRQEPPALPPVQTTLPQVTSEPVVKKSQAAAAVPSPLRLPRDEKGREGVRRHRQAASHREPEAQLSYSGSPALTVSGIAYQDNPAESMAVVNGALVKSGMTVAGVQVDRIFVDRVRFRGNGGVFEVPLAR